jgi:3-dehydroquinate synthase
MTESSPGKATKRPRPLVLDVHVPAESRSYPVLIGRGAAQRLGAELQQRLGTPGATVALISDTTVFPLHGAAAQQSLEAHGLHGACRSSCRRARSTRRCRTLLGALEGDDHRRDGSPRRGGRPRGRRGRRSLRPRRRRCSCAACPVIQCPTTLLAQVDASVGGKVAVDLPAGKNMVGAFHFPLFVLIDPELLGTLARPRRCRRASRRCSSTPCCSRRPPRRRCWPRPTAIYARNFDIITPLVATSVGLKAACVGRDPWETGEAGKGRVLLNLGHTVGHAIEAASGFAVAHGEAVALGLRAAARISELKGSPSRASRRSSSTRSRACACRQISTSGWSESAALRSSGRCSSTRSGPRGA